MFLYDGRMNERHRSLWQALEESVLRTDGHTAPALRQAAAACAELPPHLTALVEKIHRHAYRVTDEDLASLRAQHSEDELFEIIVAAALGAAAARLQAGLRALDQA
jgi:alkylhydroperoxidase family enzyme